MKVSADNVVLRAQADGLELNMNIVEDVRNGVYTLDRDERGVDDITSKPDYTLRITGEGGTLGLRFVRRSATQTAGYIEEEEVLSYGPFLLTKR